MKRTIAWLAALGTLVAPGHAGAADPVAYITEIQKKGSGEVRMRAAGEAEWSAPRPLQALRPGDQLRAQGDARLVVLFHAGGGTKTITPDNSPFTITAPVGAGGASTQLRTVAASVSQFLLGRQVVPRYRRLATRGLDTPPLILSPRDTRLLSMTPTFQWEGSAGLRYTLRVIGPQGVVWEQANLARTPIVYPTTAPPLAPRVPYHWELEAPGHPTERAQFEILTRADAARVEAALAALDGAAGYSPGTLTVMRTAFLFEEGLYDEARRRLETTLAAQPDEPTLRLLQGHVYQRIGLAGRAAEAFDRAQELMR